MRRAVEINDSDTVFYIADQRVEYRIQFAIVSEMLYS